MSTQLIRVQERYKDEDRLMLLSHSVTPETDSVPVLKAYAEKYGVDHRRWRLMTGDREQIYRLARNSYFAAVDQGDGGPEDFVHTENFVLVDPQGRIRGFYDGTKPAEVDKAMADIQILLDGMPS
jgi:protein SCO1/2